MTTPSDAPTPPAPQDRPRTGPSSVVAGAFALLRALGQARRPVGVTLLACTVGLPKTTAHRLLKQMAAEGVVEQRDHAWLLGPGLHDLAPPTSPTALAVTARPRLQALSTATGATLFLHQYHNGTLEALCHLPGAQVGHHVSAAGQKSAARHPRSAIWQALETGRPAAEYGQVRPECNCIAVPFRVPGGDTAVLSLARPASSELNSLKRPLERMAHLIRSDLRAFAA